MADSKPDLTTTDGVVDHLTDRIRSIVEREGGVAHPDSIRGAKEQAHAELLAELFGELEELKDRVKALEPNTEEWDCQTCGKPIENGPGYCGPSCFFAEGKPREPHSSS